MGERKRTVVSFSIVFDGINYDKKLLILLPSLSVGSDLTVNWVLHSVDEIYI